MKIQGRTFIVSGGASGLGRACILDICSRGGYAAILDLHAEAGNELVNEIGRGKTRFFECDVTETESIASAVKGSLAWVKETGMEVGGVITAAGVGNPAKILDRHLNPFSLSDFDFVMNINVRGTIDLIRQLLPHMAQTTPVGEDGERGIVVMVSSSAAFDGQPGQVSYAASKGAIASLTLPMTRDLSRYGIRVVTLAPSMFDSRMTSMLSEKARASLKRVMEFPPRPGQPHEFAQLVTQSIENIMLNGVVLRLDGGMRMPSKM
ncbi:putative 3-hydroxyacyl-CoA dehydrogenase-like protein [Amylocarpus encephaloides]|uniref:3-hydroxyacyl-CoA dehydrogenase-like protein n=1 Tax=Amylocarpus encephaloides TaxID=45428 RepID=A0A9P7YM37_9HELO|nr:putative 3-hydroxyacyl-CoA dehydrogenase-like protein [Amylocarpus encephaloides]